MLAVPERNLGSRGKNADVVSDLVNETPVLVPEVESHPQGTSEADEAYRDVDI